MTVTTAPAVVFRNAQRLDRCPICRSPRLRHKLTDGDYHYQIVGEFSADECQDCALVFMNPMPSARDLAALYPDDYYAYQPPRLPHPLKEAVKAILGLRKRTLLPRFAQPGTMLDVGCGSGQYMLEMKARGWEVYGAELSQAAATAGRSAGLNIRSGEIMDAGFADAMFDFVRSNHSLEHIPNPVPVLSEIRRILKSDGKLFIGVPNINGAMAKLFGRYWWYMCLPVHTYSYNPRNLSRLLEQNGFRVERVRYYSDYGGTLGSLQILLNRNRLPRTSDGRIVRSKLLRLPGQYLARALDVFRMGDCIEIIASPSEDGRP